MTLFTTERQDKKKHYIDICVNLLILIPQYRCPSLPSKRIGRARYYGQISEMLYVGGCSCSMYFPRKMIYRSIVII